MTRILIACAAIGAALIHPTVASAAAAKRKPAVRAATPAAPRITFTVVSEGKGASPGPEDIVLLAYIGRLADGTVFDQDGKVPLPVAEVVPGFSQALRRVKRGGSYHVIIPPSLAYGAEASGPVPANATLTFDMLVFDFKNPAEIAAMRKAMEAQTAEEPKPSESPKP